MEKEEMNPEYIVFMAEDTFSPLFWDEDDVGIGDDKSFYIGDDEYSTLSLIGMKEWFLHADKYNPYTDVTQFTTEGMDDWINQGYEYAKQLRSFIPKSVDLYYGFWHQFGDGRWRRCRAYISPF